MTAYENLFRLDGRRAVVLGAASGIGRESARALAAHGASVVCADRDLAGARETAASIGGQTYEIDLLEVGAAERAAADLGDLDVVVLTAATNVRKRLLDYTRDEFDRVIALNLGATFDVDRAFGAGMVDRQRGSIIGLSSIRGTTVARAGPLRGYEGRYGPVVAHGCREIRSGRGSGERNRARRGGNAVDRTDPGESRLVPRLRDQERARALGARGRVGRSGGVPRLGRREFRDRPVLAVDGGWTAVDGRFEPSAS